MQIPSSRNQEPHNLLLTVLPKQEMKIFRDSGQKVVVHDRATLRQCLLKANDKFRVYEAGSGETAIDWFRAVQPDCVVMELKSQDMMGMDVLDRITLEISKKPVPIFIWTNLNLPY